MTTTTQVDNIPQRLDLTAYAGDYVDDFDMDAVHGDYVTAINDRLPAGVTLADNGMVFADVDVAYDLELDWDAIAGDVDVAAIFHRHDVSVRAPETVTREEVALGLADRGLTNLEVSEDAIGSIWVFVDDGRRVVLRGEANGWTWTYYAHPYGIAGVDDTGDGLVGAGPEARDRMLDAVAYSLKH